MLERNFVPRLLDEIDLRFPGAVVLKNDPGYLQGIPDRLVLFENKWAMLETKRDRKAKRQPNQPHYIDLFNSMSYARFVCPENAEEVLHEIEQTFRRR